MLISKILLRKLIHEVTSSITFDYSDSQQNSMCKLGSAQKRKMHMELERLHLQQCLSQKSFAECVPQKKNRQHFHHHTAYDYRKEIKSCWYTTSRCWYTTSKPFFSKNVTNPGLQPTNVAVYDKPNWTPHFQVASHFGRRQSTIGGLCR